ncbi:MAG: glycosyltransferase family 2 protein [Nitrospinales bacterium]
MNSINPTISVIIPTFNRKVFLEKAIDSVLNQTFCDFELIVVDDGSTDDSKSIFNEREGINYIRLNENAGVSKARNMGIKEARGKLICFLDSDDSWIKDKLERQINCMNSQGKPAACYTDEIWIRNGKRVNSGKRHQKYSGEILKHCLPLCIISPSSIMLRREVLDEIGYFDESLPACEDYDLWLRLAARHSVEFIPQKLIIKTGGHSDQLSHKYDAMDRFRVYAIDKLLGQVCLDDKIRKLAIEILNDKCCILLNGCIKRGNNDQAINYRNLIEKYSAE